MSAEDFREYEIQKREDGSPDELGRGAMGVTYKAFDTRLERFVALRIISPEAMASPEAEARFIREARAAARLRHPNIPTVYCLGDTPDNAHFYAMELCQGESVEQLVGLVGRLDWRWALEIAAQAANALAAAARENLTHHNIKPSNLALVRADESEVLKVVEFGLVNMEADEGGNETSLARASSEALHFASPERIQNGILDTRSDIYSLGATLWFMLSGAPPFIGSIEDVIAGHLTGEPEFKRLTNVPEKVVTLIRRMLEKSVDDRPQTARELSDLIKECLQRTTEAQPPPDAEPTSSAEPTPSAEPTSNAKPTSIAGPIHSADPASIAELPPDGEPAPEAQSGPDAQPGPDTELAPDVQSATDEDLALFAALQSYVEPEPFAAPPVTDGPPPRDAESALLDEVANGQRTPLSNPGAKGNEAPRRAVVNEPTEDPRSGNLTGSVRAATADHHAPVPQADERSAPRPERRDLFRGQRRPAAVAAVVAVAIGSVTLAYFTNRARTKAPPGGSSPANADHSAAASLPKPTAPPDAVRDGAPMAANPGRGKARTDPLGDASTDASAGVPGKPTQAHASTPNAGELGAAKRFERLVAEGKSLREHGDPNAALTRFREAAQLNPQSPIPIAEIAMSYEKMGLGGKAGEQWQHLHDMGEAGGIYFTLAEARLKAPAPDAPKNEAPVVVLSEQPNEGASGVKIVFQQDSPQNSLGMKFVDAGTEGVAFCIWQTRVRDFQAYVNAANVKSNAWRKPGFSQGPDHPVVNVTWREANAFCKWLTEKEHREGSLPANRFYRLPTDLEWSRAVGLPEEPEKTPAERDMRIADVYPWGKDWPPPPGAGNYNGEDKESEMAIAGYKDGFEWTSPVGSFKPNPFGIYDMGGNVWQWCMDSWNENSPAKVLRGASWYNGSLKTSLLSSCRIHADPDSRADNYGFRIVEATDGAPQSGAAARKTKHQ